MGDEQTFVDAVKRWCETRDSFFVQVECWHPNGDMVRLDVDICTMSSRFAAKQMAYALMAAVAGSRD